jgi:hypothetical protein
MTPFQKWMHACHGADLEETQPSTMAELISIGRQPPASRNGPWWLKARPSVNQDTELLGSQFDVFVCCTFAVTVLFSKMFNLLVSATFIVSIPARLACLLTCVPACVFV